MELCHLELELLSGGGYIAALKRHGVHHYKLELLSGSDIVGRWLL